MADLVAPVTRQGSWEMLGVGIDPMFGDTSALSAPSAYAHRKSTNFWTGSSASPGQYIAIEDAGLESNSLSLSFFGKEPGSGSGPFHAIGALWVASKLVAGLNTEFRGTFLGEFELTLGATLRDGTGGILPDGVKWVKAINPVKDRALFPGIRIVGQEGDAPPEMILDGIGGWGYLLELRCLLPGGASGSAMESVGAMRRIL